MTTQPIETFYQNLQLPESCYLGKKIFKKFFYEMDLNATDKKAFSQDIVKITWSYTLKPETINIGKYEDGGREYLEVAVIAVELSSVKRYKRIAALIQRAIPYPVLLVFSYGDELALDLADKRISRSDSSKIMVEAGYDTDWLSINDLKGVQADFLNDFCLPNFSYHNFYDFYQDMVQRVIALNCATHSGRYSLSGQDIGSSTTRERASVYRDATALDKRLQLLKEFEALQQEKAELRNRLKKEKNMGTQVQLNTKVKKLSDRLETLLGRL